MGYFSPPPHAEQFGGRLPAAVNTEFAVEAREMHMHGGFCHPEARADFFVAQVYHQAAGNVLLTDSRRRPQRSTPPLRSHYDGHL